MNQPTASVSKNPFGGAGTAAKPPATTNAPATGNEMTPMKAFSAAINTRRSLFAAVLPKHTNADRFIRSVMIAVAREPKLLDCEPTSMFNALHQAASLGLEVSGQLGSAYLVPFRDNKKRDMCVQLIPGYRGLIGLARQSGEIESIDAFVVYERDECHVQFGTDPKIEHRPAMDGDPGKPRFFYSVATFKGGGKQFIFMTKAQVDAVKRMSKASGSGPWVDHYEEMGKKTVIRRLMKYLPLSVEKLARALEIDEAVETGRQAPPEIIDVAAFEAMAADARVTADLEGAPGAVDVALESVETTTREPGVDDPDGAPADAANPFTAAAEPAKPKESFADVAKRAAAKAGGA